jgi:hypothetical protein
LRLSAGFNDVYLAKGISATAGAGPIKSSIKAATVLQDDPWVQFGFEQSNYSSYAVPTTLGICTTKVAGKGKGGFFGLRLACHEIKIIAAELNRTASS